MAAKVGIVFFLFNAVWCARFIFRRVVAGCRLSLGRGFSAF
jgi:hypothetical protein